MNVAPHRLDVQPALWCVIRSAAKRSPAHSLPRGRKNGLRESTLPEFLTPELVRVSFSSRLYSARCRVSHRRVGYAHRREPPARDRWAKPALQQGRQDTQATPTHSWSSKDVGSHNPFNLGRFGSLDGAWAGQVPSQEAEDPGSDRASFRSACECGDCRSLSCFACPVSPVSQTPPAS